MNDEELKDTLDSIVTLGNQLRVRSDLDERATPSAPLSALHRQRLLEAIPDVPPSFLRVLQIYDGVQFFEWADISLRGADYLCAHRNLDASWVEAGRVAEGELLIIGESESDANVIAFLRSTAREDGEMEVMDFDSGGEIWRYPDLETCLKARLKWFRESLREAD